MDHPLCEECTDTLLDLMDQQLRLTEEELNDYSNFLRRIENDDDFENYEGLEKELENVSTVKYLLNKFFYMKVFSLILVKIGRGEIDK